MMEREAFFKLETDQVARLVRANGPKVCVLPINGTRRWFMLEHAVHSGADSEAAYLDAMIAAYIRLFKLLFDHGLHTVLSPAFGPDLMARGEDYARMAATGWVTMVGHPDFVDFCERYRVRIRFYGDYVQAFAPTSFAHLVDVFEDLEARTADHDRCRLFFGLFAHDATERVAGIGAHYYQEHGHLPDRKQIVEAYYGEVVEPVDLFIGFDKFSAFDMPLLATGSEDLYFTIAPSPYLNERQLYAILYDHLYARRTEPDYAAIGSEEWSLMQRFYHLNLGNVLGIGTVRDGIWYPLPQVELPEPLKGFVERD
jgi:tuberculosinol/isotuberculosinol synthase